MAGAFVVTLLRPQSWLIGLAGFLAGGGIVLLTVPVAILPTLTGLQNALGGPVSTLVVGTPSASLLLLISLVLVGACVMVIAGLVTGAWAERQGTCLALAVACDEGLVGPAPDLSGAPGTGRIALLRGLSLVPVAIAAGLAWPPLYDATYRELTLPTDLASPLPVRVIRAVPWSLAAIAITWLISDAAASVGVRRLLVERQSFVAAWALGWWELVRRPLRVLGTALVGGVAVVLVVAPAMLAATAGWERVREVLLGGGDPVSALLAVLIWVAIWSGGLVLAGVGAAVRVAAWTLEAWRGT
jgi:hypothetical protein